MRIDFTRQIRQLTALLEHTIMVNTQTQTPRNLVDLDIRFTEIDPHR